MMALGLSRKGQHRWWSNANKTVAVMGQIAIWAATLCASTNGAFYRELGVAHCQQLAHSAGRAACTAFASAANTQERLCAAMHWKTADLPSCAFSLSKRNKTQYVMAAT
jgi:hypothetical protein